MLPQAVVGRKVTIVKTHSAQPFPQGQEMAGLICRGFNPVIIKLFRQAAVSIHGIPSQIYRGKFYMGKGVDQGGTSGL
jgi:hypothetical protein